MIFHEWRVQKFVKQVIANDCYSGSIEEAAWVTGVSQVVVREGCGGKRILMLDWKNDRFVWDMGMKDEEEEIRFQTQGKA